MAGTNQAANLGGMISQIAGTLGTKVDSEPYVRGTENAFRPDADPSDLGSMRNLMEWQQRMGRSDEARNTLVGIRDLEAKEKEAKLKREGQARAAGAAEYQKAMKTGDAAAIASAEDAMYKIGEVQGIDVTNLLAGIEQRSYAEVDQAYQVKERERVALERVEAEKTKKNAEAFSVAMNQATDLDTVEALRKGATPDLAGIAGDLAQSAEGRIVRQQERALAEADLKAPMQETNLILPESLTGTVAENFKNEASAIDKDIKQLNKDIANGTVLNPNSAKADLKRRRNNLEVRVGQASDGILIRADADARATSKAKEKQISDLEILKRAPLNMNDVRNVARGIAGVDDKGQQIVPSQEDMIAARTMYRASRTNDIDEQIRFIRGDVEEESPWPFIEVGTIKEGKRYMGDDPGDPANWEDVESTDPAVPDYVRYDREKVESIRSKIPPLNSGKYTYTGGTRT